MFIVAYMIWNEKKKDQQKIYSISVCREIHGYKLDSLRADVNWKCDDKLNQILTLMQYFLMWWKKKQIWKHVLASDLVERYI